MKKQLLLASIVLPALLVSSGCVGLSLGSGPKTENHNPTLGQQLIDLQKARDTGAITPGEYDAKKAELLARK